MILTCPSCSARFTINTELIGPAGRKVRCGSCGHTWRQLPTVENDAQPPPQGPIDMGVDMGPVDTGPADTGPAEVGPLEVEAEPNEWDAVRRVRRRSAAALRTRARPGVGGRGRLIAWSVLGTVVMLLIGTLWLGRGPIVTALPEAARFYELFGIGGEAPGEGLALQEVTSVRRTFDGQRRLIIEGVVANVSDNDRPVPTLRASLHDASGQELAAWYFTTDVKSLSPGERTTFSTLAQSPPDGATELTINFVAEVPQDKQ